MRTAGELQTLHFHGGHGHFRHAQKANATFADGQVGLEKPVPGSLDKRLPAQRLGQLRLLNEDSADALNKSFRPPPAN